MLLGTQEYHHWKNYKSINKYSIGIEISNPGHEYLVIKIFQKNKLNQF